MRYAKTIQVRPLDATARGRWSTWIEAASAERLLDAILSGTWAHDPIAPSAPSDWGSKFYYRIHWSLSTDEVAAARSVLVRRIESLGGRADLGRMVAIVDDGELRITMA